MCFFFFKQKTAYEMRISDWSSDVCSSDLAEQREDWHGGRRALLAAEHQRGVRAQPDGAVEMPLGKGERAGVADEQGELAMIANRFGHLGRGGRSEEHTSELQSLMRI